jgi:DNA-binding NarL/FixJ family response regulator
MAHTILIVDDNPSIRRLLRSFLETKPDFEVCGEAENGQVALQKVEVLRPDVVILDWQMPVMNGLEAARHIAVMAPHTAILMLTMHGSEPLQREALASGVKAVLSKTEGVAQNLLAALKKVCRQDSSRLAS